MKTDFKIQNKGADLCSISIQEIYRTYEKSKDISEDFLDNLVEKYSREKYQSQPFHEGTLTLSYPCYP